MNLFLNFVTILHHVTTTISHVINWQEHCKEIMSQSYDMSFLKFVADQLKMKLFLYFIICHATL